MRNLFFLHSSLFRQNIYDYLLKFMLERKSEKVMVLSWVIDAFDKPSPENLPADR